MAQEVWGVGANIHDNGLLSGLRGDVDGGWQGACASDGMHGVSQRRLSARLR